MLTTTIRIRYCCCLFITGVVYSLTAYGPWGHLLRSTPPHLVISSLRARREERVLNVYAVEGIAEVAQFGANACVGVYVCVLRVGTRVLGSRIVFAGAADVWSCNSIFNCVHLHHRV